MKQPEIQIHTDHKRIYGFIMAFTVLILLYGIDKTLSSSDPILISIARNVLGVTLILITFFALGNKQYARYAQGAFMGWALYAVAVITIQAIFKINF